MDDPKIDRKTNVNVLIFGKQTSFDIQNYILARDVLSIPIFASKSAFSVGGRVLDQCQSALKFENVEALICTQDWIFGDQGIFSKLTVSHFCICFF